MCDGGSGELEVVSVSGEEGEEEAGEGGDEDGEDVWEVGRGREDVGCGAEEEEGAQGGSSLWSVCMKKRNILDIVFKQSRRTSNWLP